MKIPILFLSLLLVLCVAQDYSMGTREVPKPDLLPDEKLVIQNTVGISSEIPMHSTFRKSVSRRLRRVIR